MQEIDSGALLELFFVAQEFLEAQFQYWLSISFAAIIAASVAGERMGSAVRWVLITLYVGATALFTLRYASAIGELALIADEAQRRGLLGDVGFTLRWPVTAVRTVLFLAGTAATIWFLYRRGSGLDVAQAHPTASERATPTDNG